eukprot:5732383-Pyramimonas_sp.AAC.1
MLTNSPAWMKTYSEIQETIYIGICSLIPPCCDWIPSTVTSARWMIVLGRCGEFWAVDARSDMYVPIFKAEDLCKRYTNLVHDMHESKERGEGRERKKADRKRGFEGSI